MIKHNRMIVNNRQQTDRLITFPLFYFRCGQSLTEQPEQPQEHLPFFLLRIITTITAITAAAISATNTISNALIRSPTSISRKA